MASGHRKICGDTVSTREVSPWKQLLLLIIHFSCNEEHYKLIMVHGDAALTEIKFDATGTSRMVCVKDDEQSMSSASPDTDPESRTASISPDSADGSKHSGRKLVFEDAAEQASMQPVPTVTEVVRSSSKGSPASPSRSVIPPAPSIAGFEVFCKTKSPIVSSITAPRGVSSSVVLDRLSSHQENFEPEVPVAAPPATASSCSSVSFMADMANVRLRRTPSKQTLAPIPEESSLSAAVTTSMTRRRSVMEPDEVSGSSEAEGTNDFDVEDTEEENTKFKSHRFS